MWVMPMEYVDKMNFTSRSVQSGCSLSTINYVGFMLITANTMANLVSNLNVNNNNNDDNNNDNNNNNNNDNMNTNMNGKRSFDFGSKRGVNDFGKLKEKIKLNLINICRFIQGKIHFRKTV